jgi:hypothetical protein
MPEWLSQSGRSLPVAFFKQVEIGFLVEHAPS